MSDLENNVDEDGGFSLAQLAGFDASDVAEIRFDNLPGGAYVFNGTGVKLETTKNREDETRFKLTINLAVAEVQAVTERGESGRASCRARVCQNVYISAVAGALKKTKHRTRHSYTH